MNDKQQFYKEFYRELEKAMEPSGGHLKEIDIHKNNTVQKGIVIKFDNVNVAPTVYPDLYYPDWKQGYSVDMIVSGIRTRLLKTAPTIAKFDIDNISRDNAPLHLRAAIVNYENNKNWLKEIPHERIADLAVFTKWDFENNHVTVVNDYLLAKMGLTKEEALKIAKTNTGREAELMSMDNVMEELVRETVNDEGLAADLVAGYGHSPLYMLSNKEDLDGAAAIADSHVLKQVHDTLEEDFYILPSSIHEVMIIPKSEIFSVEELKNMVHSINQNEVPLEDRLSDNVYEFDGHSLKLAGMDGLTEERDIADTIKHHRSR